MLGCINFYVDQYQWQLRLVRVLVQCCVYRVARIVQQDAAHVPMIPPLVTQLDLVLVLLSLVTQLYLVQVLLPLRHHVGL